MNKLFPFISLLLFLQCSSDISHSAFLGENLLEIKPTGEEIRLPLDNETSRSILYFQKTILNGQDVFILMNRNNNALYFYNLKDETLIKKQSFQKEGPDGVGILMGFHVVSYDSIYVLGNGTYTLSLLDSTSTVKKSLRMILPEDSEELQHQPWADLDNPIVLQNKNIYLRGSPVFDTQTNKEKARTLIKANMNLDTFEYLCPYPLDYAPNQNLNYYWTRTHHTFYKNSIYYSYPLYENVIQVTNDTTNIIHLKSNHLIDHQSQTKLSPNSSGLEDSEEANSIRQFKTLMVIPNNDKTWLVRSIMEPTGYKVIDGKKFKTTKTRYLFHELGTDNIFVQENKNFALSSTGLFFTIGDIVYFNERVYGKDEDFLVFREVSIKKKE